MNDDDVCVEFEMLRFNFRTESQYRREFLKFIQGWYCMRCGKHESCRFVNRDWSPNNEDGNRG